MDWSLRYITWTCFVTVLLFEGCQNQGLTPASKPRAYPKVDYPEYTYQHFDKSYCNFAFEFPSYAKIEQEQYFFGEQPADPCWFDLYIPAFESRLHCSYVEIGKDKTFEELKADAFELADYHNKRANYIEEIRIGWDDKTNVEGFVFSIEGPAATPFQFYLTDGEEHFFRASLYFNTQVQPDSLQPIYDFLRKDILHMIETFSWSD